jgi:hypothetical protein
MRRLRRPFGVLLALALLLSLPAPVAQARNPILLLPKPSPPEISDPEVPNSAWMGPRPTSQVESDTAARRFQLVMRRAATWFFIHARGGWLR